MNPAGRTRGAQRDLFDLVDHGYETITREETRPARRADQSTAGRGDPCPCYQRGVSARPMPSATFPSNSRARVGQRMIGAGAYVAVVALHREFLEHPVRTDDLHAVIDGADRVVGRDVL